MKEKDVAHFYDIRLIGPVGAWFRSVLDSHARRLARHLVQAGVIRDGQRILDIGSGTGELALVLATTLPASRLDGVELASRMLLHAEAKLSMLHTRHVSERVHFHQGSALTLPFPDATFDVALSTWVCKHFADQTLVEAWREAKRVLRPGGTLIVTEFGPSRIPLGTVAAEKIMGAERLRPLDDLASSLTRSGFEAVDRLPVIRFGMPPLPKQGLLAIKRGR